MCPPQWTGKTCQLGKEIPASRLALMSRAVEEDEPVGSGVGLHTIMLKSNLLSRVHRAWERELECKWPSSFRPCGKVVGFLEACQSSVRGALGWVANWDGLMRNELSAFFLPHLNPSNEAARSSAQQCLVAFCSPIGGQLLTSSRKVIN